MTKPSERLSVLHVVDDVEQAIAFDRRRFIKRVGHATGRWSRAIRTSEPFERASLRRTASAAQLAEAR